MRGEEVTEEGIVLARDEAEAKKKLRPLQYREVKLRKLTGLNALIRRFSADIR
jgi:hypothetical protein